MSAAPPRTVERRARGGYRGRVKPASLLLFGAGLAVCSLLAFASELAHGPRFAAGLDRAARQVLAGTAVRADFSDANGWLTRHPLLLGGTDLAPDRRIALAERLARIPGIGGVRWSDIPRRGTGDGVEPAALHCQDQVDGILKTRSIRFDQASAAIDPSSAAPLDEVAAALRPCAGSIVAIIGHTDAQGDEASNVALSFARADAVRRALIGRGIAADGLRAKGVGSQQPVAGLAPNDPANRRIEFSVIAPASIKPTVVDTPGAG